MGLCESLSDDEREEIGNSKLIDKVMKEEAAKEESRIKLLLLGTGESGKSTIFKQMKILYGNGFSAEELERYKWHIWSNIVETVHNGKLNMPANKHADMCAVCDAAVAFGYADNIQCKDAFNAIRAIQRGAVVELNETVKSAIQSLWNDSSIVRTLQRRNEFQTVASVFSYIPRLDEIARSDYSPSVEDVLLSRVRTAGITEERYDINGQEFVIVDVGGQKNERRKWIHCFDNVKAIVFVVALSEFDEVLFEDNSLNRMLDSLTLFSSVCKNPHLKGISIILFLNKSDLFREKIARVNLCDVPQWTDYSGAPHSYDEGVDYFINKFIGTNRDKRRDIFYQVTCATDTSNIRFVWNACTEILLKEDLDKLGFVG